MMKPHVCMVVFVCGLLAAGCVARNEEPGAFPRSGGGDAAAATVNGFVIARAQVDRAVAASVERFRGQVPPDQIEGMKPILRKQALESLVNHQLLVQEADREGIKPDEKKIDAQLKEISGRAPDGESFKKLLASAGITESQLRQDIGQDLKVEALLNKNVPQKQKASNKEIKDYYREHQEEFKIPERVKASHILVKVDAGDSAEVRAQKKLKAEKLRERIEKGEDFAKLASENSECPSKAQGGDLGYFARGNMVKPFEEAAFGMKKAGQVSGVVETEFGYHLIKLTGREEAGVTPLEKIKDKLEEFLNRQKRQGDVGDYIQKLRSSAKIEYAAEPRPGAKR